MTKRSAMFAADSMAQGFIVEIYYRSIEDISHGEP
jgi:hypothetical protein